MATGGGWGDSERKGAQRVALAGKNKQKQKNKKKGLEISISRSTVGHKQQENYRFLLLGQSGSA